MLGQKINQIYSGFNERGENSVVWDGLNKSGVKVASGNYFINIINEHKVLTRKVTLMK